MIRGWSQTRFDKFRKNHQNLMQTRKTRPYQNELMQTTFSILPVIRGWSQTRFDTFRKNHQNLMQTRNQNELMQTTFWILPVYAQNMIFLVNSSVYC